MRRAKSASPCTGIETVVRRTRRKSIEENIMQGLKKLAIGGLIAGALAPFGATAQAPVKVGVVAFLSGPAAAPFGVQAQNAAEFVIDALDADTAPPLYAKTGTGRAPRARQVW